MYNLKNTHLEIAQNLRNHLWYSITHKFGEDFNLLIYNDLECIGIYTADDECEKVRSV